MYKVKHFEETNQLLIHEVMQNNSFVTLIVNVAGENEISHLPVYFDTAQNKLIGHIARANPLYNLLKSETRPATVIFNGEHGYISNSYYTNPEENVPTWNYAVVHVIGEMSLCSDNSAIMKILDKMFAQYETTEINWNNPSIAKMVNGIIGFEICINDVVAKFKLSQNKNSVEQDSIVNKLHQAGGAQNINLARFMQNYFEQTQGVE